MNREVELLWVLGAEHPGSPRKVVLSAENPVQRCLLKLSRGSGL